MITPSASTRRLALALGLAGSALLAAGGQPGVVATTAAGGTPLYLPWVARPAPIAADAAVWSHTGDPAGHEVTLFRHHLALAQPLTNASWVLFADTRYAAWLDGQPVGRGPVRFSRQRRSYDVWPLGDLAAGQHDLAALVQWAPNTRRSESVRPLLRGHLEGSLTGQAVALARTGAGWLARRSTAWRADAAPVHRDGLLGPTELLDLRLLDARWLDPGYDDRPWSPATVVADPLPLAAWQARDIPALADVPMAASVLDRGLVSPGRTLVAPGADAHGRVSQAFWTGSDGPVTVELLGDAGSVPAGWELDGQTPQWSAAGPLQPDVYLAHAAMAAGRHQLTGPAGPWGDRPLTLAGPGLQAVTGQLAQGRHAGERLLLGQPATDPTAVAVSGGTDAGLDLVFGPRPAYVVLDLGRVVHGRLTALVEGPPGTVVDIGWDERRGPGGRPLPYAGSRLPAWNQVDSWILAATPRPIATLDERTGRYVLIAAWVNGGVVALTGLRVTETQYPATQRGRFHSDRPNLDRIWQVGVDTLRPNMEDAYADPWRERGHWFGDAFVDDRISRAALGDPRLFRRSLALMADGFQAGRPSALTPGAGPELLDFGMLWVQGLADHGRRLGDSSFVRSLYPQVAPFLDHLAHYEDPATGLLDLPERPGDRLALIDWGTTKDWGTYYSRYGQSTAVNAMYYGTLRAAADLATAVGAADRAQTWLDRAERLRAAINQHLYLPDEHRYLTTRHAGRVVPPWPHAQAWALAYEVVPAGDEAAVADQLVALLDRDPAMPNVDLYGMYWLLEGLAHADRIAGGLAVIERYYGRLLDLGATTWWESFYAADRPDQSLSHAWGGSPTWFLTSHVLGAVETGPSRWQVRPALVGLDTVTGTLPLASGELDVAWRRTACGEHTITVDAPTGTSGTVVIPHVDQATTVMVDGLPVWLDGQPTAAAPSPSLAADGLHLPHAGGHRVVTVARPCRRLHLPLVRRD